MFKMATNLWMILALTVSGIAYVQAGHDFKALADKLNLKKDAQVTVTILGKQLTATMNAAAPNSIKNKSPTYITTSFGIGGSTQTLKIDEDNYGNLQVTPNKASFSVDNFFDTNVMNLAKSDRVEAWQNQVLLPILKEMRDYMSIPKSEYFSLNIE